MDKVNLALSTLDSLKEIQDNKFKQQQLQYIRSAFGLEAIDCSTEHFKDASNQTKFELKQYQMSQEGIFDAFKKKIPFDQTVKLKQQATIPSYFQEDPNKHYQMLEPLLKGVPAIIDKMIEEANKVDEIEKFVKVIRSHTSKVNNRLVPRGLKYEQVYPSTYVTLKPNDQITLPNKDLFTKFNIKSDQTEVEKRLTELFGMWQDYIFDEDNEGAEDHYKDVHDFLSAMSASEGDSALSQLTKENSKVTNLKFIL